MAWFDTGGGLHVGQESMGADPGPACYDNGGTEATVTDADVLLGYIDPDYFLGGEMRLKAGKAREAVGRVAKRLGYSATQAADGIFRIINGNMINAIRVVSVERVHDPRKFTLLSYGGAGGVHATAIIEELGIDRVIIPQTASAFSAYGLLSADLRYDFVTTVYKPLREVGIDEVQSGFREMVNRAKAEIGKKRQSSAKLWFEYAADMRYAGRGHDMRVALQGPGRINHQKTPDPGIGSGLSGGPWRRGRRKFNPADQPAGRGRRDDDQTQGIAHEGWIRQAVEIGAKGKARCLFL